MASRALRIVVQNTNKFGKGGMSPALLPTEDLDDQGPTTRLEAPLANWPDGKVVFGNGGTARNVVLLC